MSVCTSVEEESDAEVHVYASLTHNHNSKHLTNQPNHPCMRGGGDAALSRVPCPPCVCVSGGKAIHPAMVAGGVKRLMKSRYGTISCYICNHKVRTGGVLGVMMEVRDEVRISVRR